MDPDGLSILLLCAGGALSLATAYGAGALCENESERDEQTCLGFSNRMAGLAGLFLLGFACFAWGAVRALYAAQLWVALCVVAFIFCSVLCFALGRAKGSRTANAGAACIPLGLLFATPARILFRAAGLTAISSVTEEDLFSMVEDVEEQDLIDENQKEMIEGIFELNDMTAGEIMTHRTEVVAVEETATAAAVVQLAAKEGVSRLPVYRKTMDEIVGIVYVKDLFHIWGDSRKSELPVSQFLHTPLFVPEACRARELLVEFKLKRMHIAIVVDEYGGTSGIVSMEDILEEIVGNIQDEFDHEEEDLVCTADGCEASGSADLEDVFDALGVPFPEDDARDFDSVGGLIIDRLGRIPTEHESITVAYGGVMFTVLQVGERRVVRVQCTVQTPDSSEQPSKP